MKKFLLQLFVLSSAILVMSCSSDDDASPVVNTPPPPSIFGQWKYIGFVENGEFVDDEEECESQMLTINENNTGLIQMEDCDFGPQSAPFTWQNVEGNKYNLTALGTSTAVFITFPSGNDRMHITEEADPTYSDVFQRQ